MRPVPTYSTDFLYAGDFRREEMMEIGEAMGLSNINVVTTATLKPERLLYHACLNGIQTYVKLKAVGEVERAREIADLADAMYTSLLPDFQKNLAAAVPRLEAKEDEAHKFCSQLEAIEGPRDWSRMRYQNTWNTNDYPPRWQKKTIETYGLIRERMAKGEYTPPPQENAGSLTHYWIMRNLEYKHYRDIARLLVEYDIQKHTPQTQQLTMRPAAERTMTMFIGGMAAGKSALTEYYMNGLPEEERADLVLHDADYLKYALYRSAFKDGVLPKGHIYVGAEVHAESSNALYEGTRKRAYLARQKFLAPNVVLNSIALNAAETQEGIASGGRIVAHHVHISPEEAIIESEKRRRLIGRVPAEEDTRWSAKASAQSLLLMAQPEYKGTNIILHLYHREAGHAPKYYATIDANHCAFTIYDQKAFLALCQTAELDGDRTAETFTKHFVDAGYKISHQKSHVVDATKTMGVLYVGR